jgi:hypothetical protein
LFVFPGGHRRSLRSRTPHRFVGGRDFRASWRDVLPANSIC